MKKLFSIFLFALCSAVCYGQNLSISVEKEIWEDVADLDAKVYFPKTDQNDKKCALVKVTLTNKLKNPLVLEVGGLGVVAREEQESGEVWFYLPAQVKNLTFKCAEYTTPSAIPVRLKEGAVYRIVLNSDAIFETISNAILSTNYLKIGINEPNATISIGRTKSYELLTRVVSESTFQQMLEYGTYYYKVEHSLYETYYGEVVLNASTTKQNVTLKPAYGYLDIASTPTGATVLLNGRSVGTTPCSLSGRIPRGRVSLHLECEDYHPADFVVEVKGDGSRQTVTKALKPRFANISLVCPDAEAEIWVDNELKGKGSWSGRLNSITRHFVETRRVGHYSQSVNITVVDGEDRTHTLKAPVALYGTLDLTTTPLDCLVSIDGKSVGESPIITQLLVGEHTVKVSKSGYLTTTFPVNIEHNKTLALNATLEKGRLKASVSVKCMDTYTYIYINDIRVSTTSNWSGVLEEGRYVVEARKVGCIPSRQEVVIEGSNAVNVLLPRPSYTPKEQLKRWCFNSITHDYESKIYAEATWDGAYVGANLGWFLGEDSGGHLGIHGSFAGAVDAGTEFAIGPLVRLDTFGDLETHLYSGIGYNTHLGLPKYELGVRLAYDIAETDIHLSSISLGAEFIGGNIVPKVGLSMFPLLTIFDAYEMLLGIDVGYAVDEVETTVSEVNFNVISFPSFNEYWDLLWLGWYGSIGFSDYGLSAFGGISISSAWDYYDLPVGLSAGVGTWGDGLVYEVGAYYSMFYTRVAIPTNDYDDVMVRIGLQVPLSMFD